MTDCSLCLYVELFVKYYFYAWVIGLGIWFLLVLVSKVGSDGNKFKYYAKYAMIYYATQAFATLFAPISLLRPRNPSNAGIISAVASRASTMLPITWELRNARILKEAKGAVVMANHQSSMDILGELISRFLMWDSHHRVVEGVGSSAIYLKPIW